LIVSAPGILSNDIALNGAPFFAVLVTGTSHGKLTLNSNGSFTYQPKKGFTGVDTFTYADQVGTKASQPGIVTIDVNPKSFVVTNTNDSGTGSLRGAITSANLSNSAAPDQILFDIPGHGPFTITPSSPLPAITHATIIDGYSQPGASPNTLAQGDNAVILLSLSGVTIPSTDGLTATAGGSTIRGLDIGGFSNGIHLFGNNTLIAGNFLGTDVSGSTIQANSNFGLLVDGSQGNTIGGTSPAARNLISGNGGNLVLNDGATANLIQGNFVGTDASGTRGLAGFFNRPNGIMLLSAPGNTIGGYTKGAGNLISGDADAIQILLLFGTGQTGGTVVQGNRIGTDVTGTKAIGNSGAGILIQNSGANVVGGTNPGARNIISANGGGINFFGQSSTGNLIQDNYIGVDITGTVALGNGGDGIFMSDSGNNTFGGTAMHAGNVISANGGNGIVATSQIAGQSLIQGNFIGTDKTGTTPLGNGADGILLIDAFQNTIGGTTPGTANIISANASNGIELAGTFANNNLIQGNFIGTDKTGTRNLGNVGDGVLTGVSINTIGGTTPDAGNVIGFNGGTGVGVPEPVNRIAILSNSIFANAKLGIDLGLDGVTLNHLVGSNSGPNNDQNFPMLSVAARQGNDVKLAIKGSLTSTPSTTFTLQFFANPAADPSGFGQGQNVIATTTVTTDARGLANFQYTFKSSPSLGEFISATATDPNGNTSEFSADVQVIKTSARLLAQDDQYQVNPNRVLNVVAPGVQANDIDIHGGSLRSVLVAGPANGSLTLNSDGSFTYTPNINFRGLDTFTYADVRGGLKSNVATVTIDVNPIVFTVTTTSDSGAGSLRSAITQANAVSGTDIVPILFAIPGTGPFTISPSSPLPIITHSVLIDGYSQPGASSNSLTNGDNAALQIILDGSAVGGDGLAVAASNSTVRGLAIDSFSNGIHLLPAASQDVVAGNFIGTDFSGSSPLGNSQGIVVDGSAANTIGGTTPADRNLVAANGSQNILLTNNASNNLVVGNFVGLTASGTSTLTSPANGVVMDNAPDNTVGGTTVGAGNAIAGQGGDAVQIIGPGGDVVQGNLIGTDPTGALPLGDGTDGVGISNSSNNLIGGTAPGAGNILAASRNGIFLDGAADGNVLQGNFIGTNASGATGLGNANTGIAVFNSSNNLLGGTVAGAGNVIVFNGDRGILFAFSSNGNAVEGNWIGTDPAGAAGMGNRSNGVEFIFGPSNNTVGGTSAGTGNVIANNGGAGVALTSGDVEGDAILSNSIYGNAGMGITLAPGANLSQSAPVLNSAAFSTGNTTIAGAMSASPGTTYTLQFFANDSPDPSGFGQGQTLLGTTMVTTDSGGNATFSVMFATSDTTGKSISATATDPSGDTSAFAQDVTTTVGAAAVRRAVALSSPGASKGPGLGSLALGVLDGATLNELATDVIRWRRQRMGMPI
jgi:Bacterial Ig domain